jgi:hypothetical protein
MTDTARVFPSLPAVCGKKVSAAFDGGRITSDGGVLLLASTRARRMCERLASLVPDARDPTRTRHDVADMFLARSLAIAAAMKTLTILDYHLSINVDMAEKQRGGCVIANARQHQQGKNSAVTPFQNGLRWHRRQDTLQLLNSWRWL